MSHIVLKLQEHEVSLTCHDVTCYYSFIAEPRKSGRLRNILFFNWKWEVARASKRTLRSVLEQIANTDPLATTTITVVEHHEWEFSKCEGSFISFLELLNSFFESKIENSNVVAHFVCGTVPWLYSFCCNTITNQDGRDVGFDKKRRSRTSSAKLTTTVA